MRSEIRLARAVLAVSLFVASFLLSGYSGCDSDPDPEYSFAQNEYATTVGGAVQLKVNERRFPKNPDSQPTDVTEEARTWTVYPTDQGASVSNTGIFTANQPGSYRVRTVVHNYDCSVLVVVTDKVAEFLDNSSSPHDNIQGTYGASLAATQCSTTSPDRSRSILSGDLLFTVSGQEVSVDITGSNGTHTFVGQINSGDGSFKITSQNGSAILEATGTFSNTGVSGTWKNTFSDGDVCTQPFQGNRS